MLAMPLKQRNHNYIDSSVSKWLDIHYGDASFNGRVVLGVKKRGRDIERLTTRDVTDLSKYISEMHISSKCSYYITANSFMGVERKKAQLFSLQNIVIDVDCHDETIPLGERDRLLKSFMWYLKRDLLSTGVIPTPNSVLWTGQGVQLWYALKPVHIKCIDYYSQIKTGLVEKIENLLAEHQSELGDLRLDKPTIKNAASFFRMPCTYHLDADRFGTLEIIHGQRYDTHELVKTIGPTTEVERAQKSPSVSRAHRPVALTKEDLEVLSSDGSKEFRRVAKIMKLRSIRRKNAGAETRNNYCFAVYNILRNDYSHEETMNVVYAFNNGFEVPMTEDELKSSLCTAIEKEGYRYSNQKLIELLDISKEEQDIIDLHPFNGVYVPSFYGKPNATRDALRAARREGRDGQIIELYAAGVSKTEIARKLEVGRSTVYRVLEKWQEDETESIKEQENEIEDGFVEENTEQVEVCQKSSINGLFCIREKNRGEESAKHENSKIIYIADYMPRTDTGPPGGGG